MEERKPVNSQIFIAKLHPRVTSQDLKYKFSKIGNIRDIRLKSGYAFIVKTLNFRTMNLQKMHLERLKKWTAKKSKDNELSWK
jgi:hypothetical protein